MSTCASCNKPGTPLLASSLKKCTKCKTTLYCSRDCQKADWKIHKKSCDRGAAAAASARTPQLHAVTDPTALRTSSGLSVDFLHQIPMQKDVYCRLIDCYRLRVEDEFTFEGKTIGLYADEDPLIGFREFLDRAEATGTVLPTWWNKEKREQCEKLGMDESQWSDLTCPLQKSDVQEHYGDDLMPMKLRVLAERVYGRSIGQALTMWTAGA
jgi:splicing suppressor protein 51